MFTLVPSNSFLHDLEQIDSSAEPGDRLVIRGHRQGEPERDGEIVEVLGDGGASPFVVRWEEDGHVSRVYRARTRTSSTSRVPEGDSRRRVGDVVAARESDRQRWSASAVAFLLAVPFQEAMKRDYFVTLVLSALASVLLIAPSALHRLNFRTVDKRRIVFLSNTLTVWGLLVLALAMTGVMLLIGDVLFSSAAAVLIAGSAAACSRSSGGSFPSRNAALGVGLRTRVAGTPDERSPEPTYRREP